MTIRVAFVDDHPSITWGLERLIASESPRMSSVGSAHNLEAARSLLKHAVPDVVLLDLDLGGQAGAQLIGELADYPIRFLILTGLRDEQALDAAVLSGARGVLSKTEPPERILLAIDRIHAGELWMDRSRTGKVFERMRRRETDKLPDPFASLTARERVIVAAVVDMSGAPNKAVAQRLSISENTLRNALSTIYSKTGTVNRLQLFVMASDRLQK